MFTHDPISNGPLNTPQEVHISDVHPRPHLQRSSLFNETFFNRSFSSGSLSSGPSSNGSLSNLTEARVQNRYSPSYIGGPKLE